MVRIRAARRRPTSGPGTAGLASTRAGIEPATALRIARGRGGAPPGSPGPGRFGRDGVLRILKPLWNTRPPLARKLRQRIRTTLQWCQAHGHVATNVARETIDGALPAMPAVKAHFHALPGRRAAPPATPSAACPESRQARGCALEFLVLTAARRGEVFGAAWDEIDFIAREWRIPAERMKRGGDVEF